MSNNLWWPDTGNLEGARAACAAAATGAFIVAGVTGIIAVIAIARSSAVMGIDGFAFLDVGIFAVLGFFLRRHSRVAAVLALAMFVAEKISMALKTGGITGWPLAIVLLLCFISGVRGSFGFHRLNAREKPASQSASA